MNKDHPVLEQFLAGYFNEDWVDEHESADDVIIFFMSEASASMLEKVQQELENLMLTDLTEPALQDYLLTNIGCGYYYPSEWENGKTWLSHVASILKNGRSEKINEKR